ncbi:hypothetical protein F2P81_007502 [Scophthalmus maximus]|uniref:Uncharacterized protein n=1 Tax=Scophthalmus maximus TaxID=52904 RepID=A0A6A4SZW9_SCOMX|nr:hypothetical protein F2P81_007502 [Scophthalmus maximus]
MLLLLLAERGRQRKQVRNSGFTSGSPSKSEDVGMAWRAAWLRVAAANVKSIISTLRYSSPSAGSPVC